MSIATHELPVRRSRSDIHHRLGVLAAFLAALAALLALLGPTSAE